MKRSGPIHPFTLPLIAGIVAAILWPLHNFWGIGEPLYAFAVGALGLYVGAIVITSAIAGIAWAAIRLFRSRDSN